MPLPRYAPKKLYTCKGTKPLNSYPSKDGATYTRVGIKTI